MFVDHEWSWYVAKANALLFQLSEYIMNSVGESGLVYKGFIHTLLGSEPVAIKTGKGILKNCAPIDFH